MSQSRQTMEQGTQTMARHFHGRADVMLQACLPSPFFARYRSNDPEIIGTPRPLSAKRKHPKKRDMRVSLATTESIPANTTVQLTENGTTARDSTGFQEAVNIVRNWKKKVSIKTQEENGQKPLRTPTLDSETRIKPTLRTNEKLRIRAVMPWNIQGMLRRKEKLRRKFIELFGEDEDTETLEINISPEEKHFIELTKEDENNNKIST